MLKYDYIVGDWSNDQPRLKRDLTRTSALIRVRQTALADCQSIYVNTVPLVVPTLFENEEPQLIVFEEETEPVASVVLIIVVILRNLEDREHNALKRIRDKKLGQQKVRTSPNEEIGIKRAQTLRKSSVVSVKS